MFSVPPDFGVPPEFRAWRPKVCEPDDELPDDVVPLLPPQAAATSARTATPTAAAKPRVRLRIDILLLLISRREVRSAEHETREAIRPTAKRHAKSAPDRIMLGPSHHSGNRPDEAGANRDPTVTRPLSVRYRAPADAAYQDVGV